MISIDISNLFKTVMSSYESYIMFLLFVIAFYFFIRAVLTFLTMCVINVVMACRMPVTVLTQQAKSNQ